ncbi:MAG: polysaccharide deacetylase family protein [Coriobacteriia bacterium]|nr:polysaccharide deacetylase family protein [Coriobacteriia bacterium]
MPGRTDRTATRAERVTHNRRVRAGRTVAASLVLCLLIAIVAWGVISLQRSRAAHAQPSQSPPTTSSAPASSAPTPTPAPEPAPAPIPVVQTAVQLAAVPYPGAPATTPTVISSLKPKHKYIAFTFDDGYGFQLPMLDLLEKYNAKCTVFLLGAWATSNKPILERLNNDGFEIANHTWSHADLTKLSAAQVEAELTKDQQLISSVTGNQAPYMRPPGGATNTTVKTVAAKLGYKIILWNRSFGDSMTNPTPQKVYDAVVAGGIKPGDIILGHWGSPNTYEALKRLLPELKAQGFEFVTISELIADSQP